MEPEMELLIKLAKILEPLHPDISEVTEKVVARAEDRAKSYAAMRFEQAERLKAEPAPLPAAPAAGLKEGLMSSSRPWFKLEAAAPAPVPAAPVAEPVPAAPAAPAAAPAPA